MGVVKHGNNLYGVLKDGQAQADVIRLTKSLNRDLPFSFTYKWVQSHTDDKPKHIQRPLTDIEMANNRADSLCKTALVEGLLSRDFISSDFPFEPMRIRAGDAKLTGPLRPFLRSHHGKRIAKQVFGFGKIGKKLLNEEDFDLVNWDVIPCALKEFPDTFRDWLSKHVTGCCGVNRFCQNGRKESPTSAHVASATTKIFTISQPAKMLAAPSYLMKWLISLETGSMTIMRMKISPILSASTSKDVTDSS
jgi:hypothetical protein